MSRTLKTVCMLRVETIATAKTYTASKAARVAQDEAGIAGIAPRGGRGSGIAVLTIPPAGSRETARLPRPAVAPAVSAGRLSLRLRHRKESLPVSRVFADLFRQL